MKLNQWLTLSCTALTLAACGGGSSDSHQVHHAASVAVSSASHTATTGDKVLRIGTNAEFAPFESLNEKQEIQGFDIDLLNEMAKVGHFKVEFKHTPWDGIFAALANKDVDVVASAVTITDDRKKTMDFSDSYYKITQVVLIPTAKNVTNVADLKKLSKVGVVAGQTGDLAAQKIFGVTSPNIARFDTATLLTKEVENGGVDAGISDSAFIANYIKNNANKNFNMIQIPDFEEENYGFAVRQGDKETLDLLNHSLKTIRENGKYAEIESKYFSK